MCDNTHRNQGLENFKPPNSPVLTIPPEVDATPDECEQDSRFWRKGGKLTMFAKDMNYF